MKDWLFRFAWRAAFVVAIFGLQSVQANAQDGIYADFSTSMGSFTCRLEYAIAPKTVANFIGLASGQRPWLDLPSGRARTNAFYNGIIFHRVIPGFMIQGGSPNGQGTDGPGYVIPDEFSPSLRHDSFGVLSMANSGPDSGGSQFFVTVGPTPWLNDLHSVFGKLVGGSNVVYAINHVATNANSKPLTNVVIQNIGIRRVGSAAQAFDINAQNLPLVTNLPAQIASAGTNVNIGLSNRLYAHNWLYSSTNLTDWAGTELGIEITAPSSNSVARPANLPKQFFRLAQIQYASSTFAPKNVFGRTLTLNFSGGQGTLTIAFNSSGGGTYNYNGSPGTITSYTWIQEPYNGRLWPIQYSALVPMTLKLNFDSATAGGFSGTAYPSGQPSFSVAGTFTLP